MSLLPIQPNKQTEIVLSMNISVHCHAAHFLISVRITGQISLRVNNPSEFEQKRKHADLFYFCNFWNVFYCFDFYFFIKSDWFTGLF